MNSQQTNHIYVFLSEPIGGATALGLVEALKKTHFLTLCQQYGLDPSEIEDVRGNLEVIGSPNFEKASFFLIKYGLQPHQKLVIEGWNADEPADKIFLETVTAATDKVVVEDRLVKAKWVMHIALSASQLSDMGRLLAYEVARWAGFHGKGVVRGLDGAWYSLNQHQAFIPLL